MSSVLSPIGFFLKVGFILALLISFFLNHCVGSPDFRVLGWSHCLFAEAAQNLRNSRKIQWSWQCPHGVRPGPWPQGYCVHSHWVHQLWDGTEPSDGKREEWLTGSSKEPVDWETSSRKQSLHWSWGTGQQVSSRILDYYDPDQWLVCASHYSTEWEQGYWSFLSPGGLCGEGIFLPLISGSRGTNSWTDGDDKNLGLKPDAMSGSNFGGS